MRRAFMLVIFLATLVVACSGVDNDEHAYFTRSGSKYLVELKGRRRLMAHDPVSAARGRTYEETLTLELPKLDGVIEGTEIPVGPGKLSYVGRVVITKGEMKIDLYYDDSTRHALLWNGDYTLVQKGTGSP